MKISFTPVLAGAAIVLTLALSGCTLDESIFTNSPVPSTSPTESASISPSKSSPQPQAEPYPIPPTGANSIFVPHVEKQGAMPSQASAVTPKPDSPDYPTTSGTEIATVAPADTQVPAPSGIVPSDTPAQLPTETPTKAPTPTLFWPTPQAGETATPYVRPSGDGGETLPPEQWQQWPVIPAVSNRARQIYRSGIANGNDPTHFSKVGDCQNIRQYFLGMFDTPTTYSLGDKYKNLKGTIDQFSGSWVRLSESVRTGFNVASVLTPLYANPKDCKAGESPLACEIRLWNPSIVIISMETWTAGRPTNLYEKYLRQIVEYAISRNVLPIVATKADNLEGDNSINLIVAKVAHDYDIPLWNFWAAAHPLPDNGLLEDRFHLTNGPNFFEKDSSMKLGWPVRNLTALQTIDEVWKSVK